MPEETEGNEKIMEFLVELFDFVINLIIDIDLIRNLRSKFSKKKETDKTDQG